MSSKDVSTVFCIRCVSLSIGFWKPGRSTSTSCQSSSFATPKTRRRVVFGTAEVIAIFSPTSAFTSVDLPTFGRPATAMKPAFTAPGSPTSPAGAPSPRSGDRAVLAAEAHLRDRNSASHWRQPPQGEAVIPIAAIRPGP